MKEKLAALISFAKKYPRYIIASAAFILVIGIVTVFALNQNSTPVSTLDSGDAIASPDETLAADDASSESLDSELQSTFGNSTGSTELSSSSSTSKSTSTQQQPGNTTSTNNQGKITMLSNYGNTLETSDWIYLENKRYSKDMSQMYDFYPIDQYAICYGMTVANNKIYFSATVDESTDNSRYVIAYCDSMGKNAKEIITMNDSDKFFTIYSNRIYYVDHVYLSDSSAENKIQVYSTDLEGNDKKLVTSIDDKNYIYLGNEMSVEDGNFFFEATTKSENNVYQACIINFSLDNYSFLTFYPPQDSFWRQSDISAKDNYLYYTKDNATYRMRYDGSQWEVTPENFCLLKSKNGSYSIANNKVYFTQNSSGATTEVTNYLKTHYILVPPFNSTICIVGYTSDNVIVYVK